MLKYSEIKNILYNSTEIQQIPDKWEESIPFFCKINDTEFVAFLYWRVSDTLTIKQLIGIDPRNGKVVKLSAEELHNLFEISVEKIKSVEINDYTKYFSDKDQYERIFCEFCNNRFSIYGQEALPLFKKIVGTDLFDRVFVKLATEYLDRLL